MIADGIPRALDASTHTRRFPARLITCVVSEAPIFLGRGFFLLPAAS
jgi:hypothetical protein